MPQEIHSPLPWSVGDHDKGDRRVVESDGGFVANCALLNMSSGKRSGSANAAYIVRAVNSFEAMRAALRAVIPIVVEHCDAHKSKISRNEKPGDLRKASEIFDALVDASKALALAEQEK